MMARLIAYIACVSLTLAVIGILAERVAVLQRLARRGVWAAMLWMTHLLAAAAPIRTLTPAPAPAAAAKRPVTRGVEAPRTRRISQEPAPTGLAAWWTRLSAQGELLFDRAGRYDAALGWTWGLGAVSLLATYALLSHALRRRRRALRAAELKGARVLVSEREGPAVIGIVRSEIVVPE